MGITKLSAYHQWFWGGGGVDYLLQYNSMPSSLFVSNPPARFHTAGSPLKAHSDLISLKFPFNDPPTDDWSILNQEEINLVNCAQARLGIVCSVHSEHFASEAYVAWNESFCCWTFRFFEKSEDKDHHQSIKFIADVSCMNSPAPSISFSHSYKITATAREDPIWTQC